jgi:hypothetical protein
MGISRANDGRLLWENKREKNAHPGSPKDMPFLDLEVLPKTFNVFHQIPGRVLFQARAPIPSSIAVLRELHLSNARSRLSRSPLVQEDDLQNPTKKGWHAIHYQRVALVGGKDESLLDTLYLFGLKKQRSFSSHPPPGPPPCRGLSKVAFIRNELCTRPHHEGRRLFDIHYHDKSIDCCQRGSRRGVAGAGMKRTWGTVSIS